MISASDPTIVCVLGMSRTGTSLTARLLDLAGVYLGPEEELLQTSLHQLSGEGEAVVANARAANPEGFWEHYRLMRLNERILRRFGGSWREPPVLPDGWELSAELDPEREDAQALLRESFADRPLWGWKDPRNCLTLPFWQRLLPQMRYVICLRNPLDVAASIEKRDGLDREVVLRLWLTYTATALVATAGRHRTLVAYEDYFAAPQRTAGRLAAFVGREGALEGPEAERRVEAAIDDRLWRNRTSHVEVLGDRSVPAAVASLHLAIQLLHAAEQESDIAALHESIDLYAERLLP